MNFYNKIISIAFFLVKIICNGFYGNNHDNAFL